MINNNKTCILQNCYKEQNFLLFEMIKYIPSKYARGPKLTPYFYYGTPKFNLASTVLGQQQQLQQQQQQQHQKEQ